jgi:hemerythrin superfamily protein
MTEASPVVNGLLLTHKIISRGISMSIRKCDEYLGKHDIAPDEAAGFSMYITMLKRVTHAHHLSEDEVAFPYFKDLLEAPYSRLKNDHQIIAGVMSNLEQCLLEISSDGIVKIREVLGEFEKIWLPHIGIEEEYFTAENVNAVLGMKEQVNIAKKLGRHGSKNSGPAPLALPFLFYNLENKEREAFMMPFPWILKKVLVPIIWKGKWKPMSPFLL